MIIDIIAVVVFLVAIIAYSVLFFYYLYSKKMVSHLSLQSAFRRSWIERSIKRGDYMVMVQGARNIIMVCSFIASSLLIGISFFAQSVLTDEQGLMNVFVWAGKAPFEHKLYGLIFLYFVIVSLLLLSIRQLLSFSYMAGADLDLIRKKTGIDGIDFIAGIFNRGMNRFTFAMRMLFFSFAYVTWFINAYVFLFVTIVLFILLVRIKDFGKVQNGAARHLF